MPSSTTNKVRTIVEDTGLSEAQVASVLYDYLAYDYDDLDSSYQEKYKFQSKKIKQISDGKYNSRIRQERVEYEINIINRFGEFWNDDSKADL